MATTTVAPQETGLPVGSWQIDPVHSSIEFQVRNMGIVTVKGFFADFDGSLEVGDDGSTRAEGTIRAASVHTRSEKRDEHLRAPDFFDVEAHPEIQFRVTGVEPNGDDLKVHGELTIKGITRPVELAVEVNGFGPDPYGGTRAGLSAIGEINRTDWGITANMALPTGGVVVGERIQLVIEVEASLKTQ
jgi:polyisoprenoid-binding protein YceI